MSRGRGYLPDPYDVRDRRFSARRAASVARVEAVNEEYLVRGILDQGGLSACVGFSGSCAVDLRLSLDNGIAHPMPSPLGAYYAARAVDGYQHEDGGAFIRSLLKAVYGRSSDSLADGVGIPSEADWPLVPANVNARPSLKAEAGGIKVANGRFERIDGVGPARVEAVLDALQARCPVILDVNADFLRDTADTISAPPSAYGYNTNHAVYLPCRFDRHGERVRMANSWGLGFADRGFCWLDSDWLMYSRDAWALVPLEATP